MGFCEGDVVRVWRIDSHCCGCLGTVLEVHKGSPLTGDDRYVVKSWHRKYRCEDISSYDDYELEFIRHGEYTMQEYTPGVNFFSAQQFLDEVANAIVESECGALIDGRVLVTEGQEPGFLAEMTVSFYELLKQYLKLI